MSAFAFWHTRSTSTAAAGRVGRVLSSSRAERSVDAGVTAGLASVGTPEVVVKTHESLRGWRTCPADASSQATYPGGGSGVVVAGGAVVPPGGPAQPAWTRPLQVRPSRIVTEFEPA